MAQIANEPSDQGSTKELNHEKPKTDYRTDIALVGQPFFLFYPK
jgi:hypothetical protein